MFVSLCIYKRVTASPPRQLQQLQIIGWNADRGSTCWLARDHGHAHSRVRINIFSASVARNSWNADVGATRRIVGGNKQAYLHVGFASVF
jgi:hypothetical protein